MNQGRVVLVGAGPGDPELMTLRAARVLAAADVVLVDELVDERCLAFTRARVIRVGKRGGCASTPQPFIERLMIRLAREGKVVARLKGGDPFVFGRGGEELAALRAAGIETEVVPGISAAIGVAAALGIPLTQRGLAHGVTFVAGHSSQPVDWAALHAAGTTLAIYMGLARLPAIYRAMQVAGFAAATPACAAQDATLPSQRAVFAPLGCLAESVAHVALGTPALIVVGDVVANSSTHLKGAEAIHVRRHH